MDQIELIWISAALVASGVFLLLGVMIIRARSRARQANQAISTLRELIQRTDELTGDVERRIDARIETLQHVLARADKIISAAQNQTPPETPSEKPRPQIPQPTGKHREILRLMQQGLDAIEIARRVQMDVGEVELVRNLHHRPGDNGAGE